MSKNVVWKNRGDIRVPLKHWPVDTTLIAKYGVNEAIVYGAILEGVKRSENRLEHAAMGRHWFYCPRTLMQEMMPWWSHVTIDKAVGSLRRQGAVITGTKVLPNTHPHSWYSLPDAVVQPVRRHKDVPSDAELREYMLSIGRAEADIQAVIDKYRKFTESGRPWKDARGNKLPDWRMAC